MGMFSPIAQTQRAGQCHLMCKYAKLSSVYFTLEWACFHFKERTLDFWAFLSAF